MRLAAAKSVLQLSRRWDLHISPEIFRFTILVAKVRWPHTYMCVSIHIYINFKHSFNWIWIQIEWIHSCI